MSVPILTATGRRHSLPDRWLRFGYPLFLPRFLGNTLRSTTASSRIMR
jgi:hypothetical protein